MLGYLCRGRPYKVRLKASLLRIAFLAGMAELRRAI